MADIRSIEQAPPWVRAAVSPPEKVAAWRDLVRRYLAGDPDTGIVRWEEVEAQLEAGDRAKAV
jgi:hypothetical protein